MKSEIAVIGNLDTILIFKMVGLDVFEVRDEKTTIEKINEILTDYKVILITEDYAPFVEDLIKETNKDMYPIITIIPSGTTDSNFALNKIEESVEHTLGINILSNQKEQK